MYLASVVGTTYRSPSAVNLVHPPAYNWNRTVRRKLSTGRRCHNRVKVSNGKIYVVPGSPRRF
ncbi:hypothetical protein BS17DRAFT_772825 [Gyrodon lividus]|nr:hypothetical protein BS17DRAFT_772825 [Gyrodon lividus]